MRTLPVFLFTAWLGTAFCTSAYADILVTVDKSAQRMTVSEDGQVLYNWPVSTGKTGHATPSGSFRAFRMEPDHFSKEWDDAPMPYSIFFTKVGHAIHGTSSKNLGMPVSHGCVRLSVANASKLYAMVQKEGVLKTKVVLTGSEQVALRNHKTMLATREPEPQPEQPQLRRDEQQVYQQPDMSTQPSPQYLPRYGYEAPRERDPGYVSPQYREPQYADRHYDQPRYAYPNYSYGEREYRPQPQYMQPRYQQPYDPYGNRGIY
jgi:hypothetical protein